MDPNATLKAIRGLIDYLNDTPDAELPNVGRSVRELVEYAAALDAWITNGGYLPTDWRSDARKAWDDARLMGYQRGFSDGHKIGYAAGEAAGINSIASGN